MLASWLWIQGYDRLESAIISRLMTEEKENAALKSAALTVAVLASLVTPFMGSAVNIALPSIGSEFGMNAVMLGWVATAYLLAAALFLLPFGKLADIHGRKKVFVIGMAIFTVSCLLCSLTHSAPMFIVCRAVQGIGSAMIFGTSVAILTSVFPPGERGRALGISVAAVYFGLSVGPFIGGMLTEHLGWRSIFLLNVPLGLIVIFIVLWKLKGEWAEARGEKLDIPGSLIYAIALTALIYGFSELPNLWAGGLVAVGVAGLVIFTQFEKRVVNPVLNIDLISKNMVFAFSNLAALINYAATFAVAFLMSLYLQYIKGMSPQEAGLVLIAQPITQAIFSPFAGWLSDRIEPRIVASAGMGLVTVGLVFLIFISETTSLAWIIGCLLLLGLGFGLFSSPNTNAIMSSVEKRYYGVASATVGTMRLTGQMLSMGIAMLIFAVFIGKVEITEGQYPAFIASARVAFIVFSGLCLAGVFASLARGRMRGDSVN